MKDQIDRGVLGLTLITCVISRVSPTLSAPASQVWKDNIGDTGFTRLVSKSEKITRPPKSSTWEALSFALQFSPCLPRQCIKKQRHHFADKGPSSRSYGFSSSHVQIWELAHKENWVPKNWCFWTVVLEETLESPLDCKEIQPVHPKGNQSWIFTEGLMLKLKLQYFGHLMQRTDS